MAEMVKETTTTKPAPVESVSAQNNTASTETVHTTVASPIKVEATHSQTTEYLIYFFFGMLETLLAFRLVFKLTGASVTSMFVDLIYSFTGVFIMPFEGIFRRFFAQGVETTSILEPATVVAIIVYAVMAWGIVKLVRIFSGEQQAIA